MAKVIDMYLGLEDYVEVVSFREKESRIQKKILKHQKGGLLHTVL